MPQDPEEEILRRGVHRWRDNRLHEIEEDMEEWKYIWGRSSFGLEHAHKTPGVFDEKFIEDLWEDVNRSAMELTRLEQEHDRLSAMGLPELVTEANRVAAATEDLGKAPPAIKNTATENTNPPTQGHALDPNASAQHAAADEVQHIITAWREIMGMELDPQRVGAHLRSLNAWQERWKRRRNDKDGS